MSQSDSSAYNEYDDFELSHPPPNKKYRVTPIDEYTESDVLSPTILGTLLPIPPPPKPETKESIQQLLAPYKPKITNFDAKNNKIYHPRISVIKHKHHSHHLNNKHKANVALHSLSSSSTTSRAPSECTTGTGYITVYDVPDSCWSLIFHFCTVQDLVFNIASSNRFFQSLVIDQSTWIHRKVILPSGIYHKSLKQKIENTLESMFLNWTSLKQLDIMLDPETDPDRVTFIWRMMCTPRPKIATLRIGNSISLPGGDLCAVNENAFKYLKLIQDIQVLDFSFNMVSVSYEAIIDFFAAQAGQIYTPPPKPKKCYLSQWRNANNNDNTKPTVSTVSTQHTDTDKNTSNSAESAVIEPQTVSNVVDQDNEQHIEPSTVNHDNEAQISISEATTSVIDAAKDGTEVLEMEMKTQALQTPLKRRKSVPLKFMDDDDSDNHHNDHNHNTNNSLSLSAEGHRVHRFGRSVLGKRRRAHTYINDLSDDEGHHTLSSNKKRKTTKSLKREMDSEDERDEDKNNKREQSQTYPHFRRRKRRRTSDSFVIRRSLHDDMNKLSPKRRRKNKTKNDSKQELSTSPPPSSPNSKKTPHQKRKPSFIANHKRHRMRRFPTFSRLSPLKHRKNPHFRKHRMDTYEAYDRDETPNHDNCNGNTPKIKKEIQIPKEFANILSSTPSPITSPIIDAEAFNSSIYGKKVRKTILSNIDPSLMSTLKDLNNDELELNLSLTLNIDSIDIGLNDNDHENMNSFENDNDRYYESYRENLSSDYLHINRKKDSMKDLGIKSKLRRIYFREVCMKSFPDLAYNYLNTKRIECLSLYTGDTSSLIAFIDKCGTYPIIKKIEIDGTSPFRWRCAPLCEALTKCINLCSIQLPSIVDAVDIIAFDSFVNAAVNLTEIGLVTGDRQLFKPIHDVINKHGFKMDINPSGLRFIFARRKNKPKLREKYRQNKNQFLQRKRSNTY